MVSELILSQKTQEGQIHEKGKDKYLQFSAFVTGCTDKRI
jgi:hypothetical protein